MVYWTMAATMMIGGLNYALGHEFLKQNIASGIQVASIPIIGDLISTLTVTLIPGIFSGSVFGGAASLIPENLPEEKEAPPQKEPVRVTPDRWPGYEKSCNKCNHVMPFDSIHCSVCGSTLKKTRAPAVKFCRYCGKRIYFIGEFCPDCGREINLVSKPKVYISH
ncbi:MAG: zinc ribbon domain-containing protein [Candidatus Bathyarchaeota archaeon]|nr:zinc ribbon domain-containing protein [Candidatus Bathyarchaeota archaeon]